MTDDAYNAYLHEHYGELRGVPTTAPWNLAGLVDADRSRVLRELGTWVGGIVSRYGLADEIPGCWAKHPALVEELLALCRSWHDAYERPDAPANAPLAWHDAFARSRERIREWNRSGCTSGLHRSEPAAIRSTKDPQR